MSEASFASLGPRLLARKGGAKPAMRPQVAPLPDEIVHAADADALEDLGWNDMGADEEAETMASSAQVVPITRKTGPNDAPDAAAINIRRGAKTNGKAVKKKLAKKLSKKKTKRAAFTLRLDSDRHLKLRLASTMHGLSAQALVTKALDAMLDDIEDLEALAQRMKRS